MDDHELVKKLEELENKQWANKALAEIRSQTKEYEYQIIFKAEEEGFLSAIKEFSSAGYAIIPDTTLFQSEVFIAANEERESKMSARTCLRTYLERATRQQAPLRAAWKEAFSEQS